jgi:hypothetical protein
LWAGCTGGAVSAIGAGRTLRASRTVKAIASGGTINTGRTLLTGCPGSTCSTRSAISTSRTLRAGLVPADLHLGLAAGLTRIGADRHVLDLAPGTQTTRVLAAAGSQRYAT